MRFLRRWRGLVSPLPLARACESPGNSHVGSGQLARLPLARACEVATGT